MKVERILAMVLLWSLPISSMAKDDVILSLKEEAGGITIAIESFSIYNSGIDLPIVISPSFEGRGLFLSFIDETDRKYPLCAQINYSDIPKKAILYFRHTVSVHENFTSLKQLYCLASGKYVLHGSYRGVYLDDGLSTIESNYLNVIVH